ncbi:hypothetical protein A3D00_01585 [Candidatus Woesebacteria bacterium RIFCSPHIGHO2_02_FULL_38_9]|uniref:Tr-type G domain-containing protein n=1 Tax=Candidatus Woesebacteria bacterium RIFCSPHIGHO2_01_FULL_39_28 TaxID=1802496 RepID=A0A1F7YJZ4_9BACT|nr:MAG: hypothetical protein A2627_04500 [Candidatus Woesebacteria bacterium RIFCSPHIGHO2_01_FULL_39_28]OGM33008.1 MAG: hypothetical protein A3D00_01585 [Candidatus Woesebacteria bacterium RIFCSPHIGHO2_02_FULL_38_9]OGM57050.1 MAG: hypothetical protein A3A50_05305 [Candidatus Woesebacteria bacterium RIFCSPLOWO2_01_FULL_38_20]
METNRAPIITVLGHVNHGKTSLLDAIRRTNIATKEAGGITQNIGASVVTIKEGKKITFIDTPGHAAFSSMRSRGAKLADIAVLVVAADDGVKPQTKESIEYIREASIPFIVAITKIDLPTADVDKVRGELEQEEVYFEGRGGNIILVPVSSKTLSGIDELLEMITLTAEVQEIRSDSVAPLEAVVIENSKDKKGLLVSVVVRNGSLEVGKNIICGSVACRVRGIFDYVGKSVKKILPGEPGQILGFKELPSVGSSVSSIGNSEITKKSTDILSRKLKVPELLKGIPIVLKAKKAGSLEAIILNLPQGIEVLSSSVGEVNESDVLFAKTSHAAIFAFELSVSSQVKNLAEKEGIKIETFKIIYELFKSLEGLVKKNTEEILGKAVIVASFPFNKKRVAGCKMTQGIITKLDSLSITRNDKEIGKVKVTSLKKQKQNVMEVKAGEEFGAIFDPQLDFREGDMILSVSKTEK